MDQVSNASHSVVDDDDGRGWWDEEAAKLEEGLLARITHLTQDALGVSETKGWKVVTCPQGHPLVKGPPLLIRWACDICPRTHKRGRTPFTKARYGLSAKDKWTCLSGHVDYASRVEQTYSCRPCNFDLCLKCYDRAIRAYEGYREISKVLNGDLRFEWMRSKLMVVGEGGAGKTSLIRTVLGEAFNQNWDSTIGADLTSAVTTPGKAWNKEKKKLDFAIQAAAGVVELKEEKKEEQIKEEEIPEKELTKEEILDRLTARLDSRMYKHLGLDAPKIEEKEEEKEEESEDETETGKIINTAEVATKFDLSAFKKAQSTASALKFTIWDYGGQTVFYALHHLFLTRYGMYLVVFSLTRFKKDQEHTMEYITFWMNSIRLHAKDAPVMIIGTHLDRLTQKRSKSYLMKVDKLLESSVGNFDQLVKSDQLHFFPLSNKLGIGVTKIRNQVEQSTLGQAFLHLKIHVKWLRCLDLISEEANGPWLPLKKVKVYAEILEITTDGELNVMLKLFHELGVIIYFDNTNALSQIVVVKPQWLIDQLSEVIRDKVLHAHNLDDIIKAGLHEDYQILNSRAIASHDMLAYFWTFEQVEFFVDLMRQTLLLSDWNYNKKAQERFYLVPSLLEDAASDKSKELNTQRVKFDFSLFFLPDGCFQRLVCLMVDYCSRQGSARQPEIQRSSAKLFYGKSNHEIILKKTHSSILFRSNDAATATKFATILKSMMRKINEDTMHSGLKWDVLYEREDGSFVKQAEAQKESLFPWFAGTVVKEKAVAGGLDLDSFLDSL